MKSLPLVSCIMPTAGREKFVPIAIRYFLRQSYPNKELIIVDDGQLPIDHLCCGIDSIKYYRLSASGNTIGWKRNYACNVANGEIIIHWDDDDWYSQDWIEYQVDSLISNNADICGLSQLFFYSFQTNQCWKYIYPPYGKRWVGGATMAYPKQFWKKNPFRNIHVGEDNYFVWGCRGKIISHNHFNGFVSILHNNNTSPKQTNNNRWHSHKVSDILDLLGNDRSNYVTE